MKRIAVVFGTRPEAIKMAPVITQLKADQRFDCLTIVTGQHREMLDQVNELFGIVPDHDLDVFSPGQSLNSIVSKAIGRLDPILAEERPDALVVQGDTSTAAAAALAAFYRNVPLIHLEAGLRTGDIYSPFPEEANRRVITQVAKLHLAPTAPSRANLQREHIDPSSIVVTGNTVIDALLEAARIKPPVHQIRLHRALNSGRPVLLCTCHRRENLGSPMAEIAQAVSAIATQHPELIVILPLHRNPLVREHFYPALSHLENVILCEPLPYGEFTRVVQGSKLVLTDSGGLQEEAPSLGKPVLVLRENTERTEALEAGTSRLVGTDATRIVAAVNMLLEDPVSYAAMATASNPYGDGLAAARAVAAIAELLGIGRRHPDFDATGAVAS